MATSSAGAVLCPTEQCLGSRLRVATPSWCHRPSLGMRLLIALRPKLNLLPASCCSGVSDTTKSDCLVADDKLADRLHIQTFNMGSPFGHRFDSCASSMLALGCTGACCSRLLKNQRAAPSLSSANCMACSLPARHNPAPALTAADGQPHELRIAGWHSLPCPPHNADACKTNKRGPSAAPRMPCSPLPSAHPIMLMRTSSLEERGPFWEPTPLSR